MIEGLPGDTWRRRERPIFIADWSSWIAIVIFIGRHWDLIKSDGWRCAEDFHAIVAWLSRDRGSFISKSGATIPPTDGPQLSCDRGHHSHRSTRSNGHDFWAKNPFKNRCIPSYFWTLDWFVKQLSEFGEKSWVLRDPLAFRLDCEAIGAGLITNHHRISSNFPLEFRMLARKKSSKIRFNPCELKPCSCGNRVSSEIWSIIRW